MIRRVVKDVGARAIHASRADRLIGALTGRSREPLVLCYHRVVEDVRRHPWSAPPMLVGLRTLEAQLDWIGRRYRFVGLDELGAQLEGRSGRAAGDGPVRGRPLAAVTFDDGYADVYHHAFPLLRRKGIPAGFFVVTGLVGTGLLQPHDELFVLLREAGRELGSPRLARLLGPFRTAAGRAAEIGEGDSPRRFVELAEGLLGVLSRSELRGLIRSLRRHVEVPDRLRDELRAVDWAMLAEMDREGVTIGSHTRSHLILANEPEPELSSELVGSKRRLEERLGHAVPHLAYPNGQFSVAVVDAAAAAGYRYGYTTCSHRDAVRPLLTIPRRTFWERSTAGLDGAFSPALAACQVRGVLDPARPCPWDHGSRSAPASLARRPRTVTAS
ncbi:MAG TPA: polysaccharide deacetylase family protein [Thermoanaerobaculia bacterium]|nr:polysaccharide deacetylase family protein [Thermoanaerobaculia bacterium]